MMHLIIHYVNTSVIPYISLDQYLTPNLYTIPNVQNMRFFCCSVYIGSGHFLGFKILNFNIFGGFPKNEYFWGMKIWGYFFGSTQN